MLVLKNDKGRTTPAGYQDIIRIMPATEFVDKTSYTQASAVFSLLPHKLYRIMIAIFFSLTSISWRNYFTNNNKTDSYKAIQLFPY